MEDPGFEESDFDSRKSFHPVQRGLVKDWEMLESLWRIMLDDIGIMSSDTTSVCFESFAFLPTFSFSFCDNPTDWIDT